MRTSNYDLVEVKKAIREINNKTGEINETTIKVEVDMVEANNSLDTLNDEVEVISDNLTTATTVLADTSNDVETIKADLEKSNKLNEERNTKLTNMMDTIIKNQASLVEKFEDVLKVLKAISEK